VCVSPCNIYIYTAIFVRCWNNNYPPTHTETDTARSTANRHFHKLLTIIAERQQSESPPVSSQPEPELEPILLAQFSLFPFPISTLHCLPNTISIFAAATWRIRYAYIHTNMPQLPLHSCLIKLNLQFIRLLGIITEGLVCVCVRERNFQGDCKTRRQCCCLIVGFVFTICASHAPSNYHSHTNASN